ncbi:hypothetical protein KC19_3G213400 [Ceratodon purpureus]|uniref:TauD/TfdA-like domain-containing protein n=1 Tax=Ceratodon purpureus TaxID=3225 RepID=A0A8T0IL50_CERPU|nr:hypothetical protein KC19_3G213400 [Ceratodon purpureus]
MLASCCHCSMDVSQARFGNVFRAFHSVPKCFPKPLARPVANRERKIAETFRDVSIVLKRTETPRNVLCRDYAPTAYGSLQTSITNVACNSFVTNVVWDGKPLVAERDIGIVQAALDTYSVVVLRNAELTLDEHIALTKLLGEPEVVTDMRNHHPDSLDVLVVNNVGLRPVIGNTCWHSDRSFLPTPTRHTILHGVVVGANGMGDTIFADMVGAHAEAPADWKCLMEGAKGVHTYDKTARLRARLHNTEIEEYMTRYPPVRHPLVRCCDDPGSNTPAAALFISELCLARLEYDDGTAVPGLTPDMLLEYATQYRFLYRHRWVRGDVIIWDNRRVLHKVASLTPGVPRVLHRTTTADDVPIPFTPNKK